MSGQKRRKDRQFVNCPHCSEPLILIFGKSSTGDRADCRRCDITFGNPILRHGPGCREDHAGLCAFPGFPVCPCCLEAVPAPHDCPLERSHPAPRVEGRDRRPTGSQGGPGDSGGRPGSDQRPLSSEDEAFLRRIQRLLKN
uniref:p15 n=1 Tax=Helicoverpa armigera stunt virus TaxID=37206 RepID=A0A1V0JZN5_HASV|nr:p15 [Helicoverpa armigera stunt virus]ARD24702.1 p15 [Helicoverpa armigera stunt virus]ARD24705.1 p15 [Helicoverpa armigera stunt virus]